MNRTTVIIVIVLLLGVALLAWPEVRKYHSDPERYEQLMGTGVDLEDAVLFPDERADFAYEQSPLATYLAYEKQFVDFDDQAVLDMGDRVAEEVAWKMLIATKQNDIREAERLMWEWGEEGTDGPAGPGTLPNEQARQIVEWIAEALIRENVYYGRETLFSESFEGHAADGRLKGDGHIDCDQISHVFLHVAWKLDLDFREVLSPLHRYLEYVGPADVAGHAVIVEPTQFRGTGKAGADDGNSPFEVGPRFFMHENELEKYGHIRASKTLTKAAGFYTHATDQDIVDGAVSEVMVGMTKAWELDTLDAPTEAEAAARWEHADRVIAELESKQATTRMPNLVSNLQVAHWRAFRWALTTGDLERAERHVERLEALKAEREALLIRGEPLERVARARLLQKQGRTAEARTQLRALREDYGGERTRQRVARSDGLAEVLVGLYELGESRRAIDRFERYLSPVLGFEKETRSDDRRRKYLAAECGRVLKRVDRRSAEWCANL